MSFRSAVVQLLRNSCHQAAYACSLHSTSSMSQLIAMFGDHLSRADSHHGGTAE